MRNGLDLVDGVSDESAEVGVRRRRSRKAIWITVALAALVGLGATLIQTLGYGHYPDYQGSGQSDVLFQVDNGDTVRGIGDRLVQAGVVASANSFVKASRGNSAVGLVQPGFYVLKDHMSAAAAADALVDPHNRVGELQIQSGWQLDDTTGVNGKVTKGILSHIAAASCATLNGTSTCLSVDDLRAAIAHTDPAQLGVPDWAIGSVANVDPDHRLEGLITPGIYNIKPGENAARTLQRVLDQSVAQMRAAGLPSASQQDSGFSPYQVLVIASIVEREAGTQSDMPKIARVLYNRLAKPMNLELDSTVDYALDRPMVRTGTADRPKAGRYDTYDNSGLPPTPISSPSAAAIEAASAPVSGTWLYFVVCRTDGTSCFADTYPQHQANVAKAQADGAY